MHDEQDEIWERLAEMDFPKIWSELTSEGESTVRDDVYRCLLTRAAIKLKSKFGTKQGLYAEAVSSAMRTIIRRGGLHVVVTDTPNSMEQLIGVAAAFAKGKLLNKLRKEELRSSDTKVKMEELVSRRTTDIANEALGALDESLQCLHKLLDNDVDRAILKGRLADKSFRQIAQDLEAESNTVHSTATISRRYREDVLPKLRKWMQDLGFDEEDVS